MNKFLVSLALVSSLSISSLVAESSTLNKTDSELLFGTNAQNVNVAVLSENEMKETKGEGILLTTFLLKAAESAGVVAGGGAVYWVGDKLGLW